MFFSLLAETPANTTAYMIAGYTFIFGTMLVYLVSLIVRRRNLIKDIEMLKELESSQAPVDVALDGGKNAFPLTGENKS